MTALRGKHDPDEQWRQDRAAERRREPEGYTGYEDKMSETKLEPCPFCGEAMVRIEQSASGPYWGHPIQRGFCPGAGFYVTDRETGRPETIAAWNRRALAREALASRQAQEPFCYVLEVPDFMGDMNNAPEQGYTDFSDVPKPGYEPLYKHPPAALSQPVAEEPVAWRWTPIKDTPEAGGTYMVGGYVHDGVLRTFRTCKARLIRTLDGPEWSYHDPERDSSIPISFWFRLPPHPEHATPLSPVPAPPAVQPAVTVTEERGPKTEAVLRRDGHFLTLDWWRDGANFAGRVYEPMGIALSPALADLLALALEARPSIPQGEGREAALEEAARLVEGDGIGFDHDYEEWLWQREHIAAAIRALSGYEMNEEHSDIVRELEALDEEAMYRAPASTKQLATRAAAYITAQDERITALERERDELVTGKRAIVPQTREHAENLYTVAVACLKSYGSDPEEPARAAKEAVRRMLDHYGPPASVAALCNYPEDHPITAARRALSESKP